MVLSFWKLLYRKWVYSNPGSKTVKKVCLGYGYGYGYGEPTISIIFLGKPWMFSTSFSMFPPGFLLDLHPKDMVHRSTVMASPFSMRKIIRYP